MDRNEYMHEARIADAVELKGLLYILFSKRLDLVVHIVCYRWISVFTPLGMCALHKQPLSTVYHIFFRVLICALVHYVFCHRFKDRGGSRPLTVPMQRKLHEERSSLTRSLDRLSKDDQVNNRFRQVSVHHKCELFTVFGILYARYAPGIR